MEVQNTARYRQMPPSSASTWYFMSVAVCPRHRPPIKCTLPQIESFNVWGRKGVACPSVINQWHSLEEGRESGELNFQGNQKCWETPWNLHERLSVLICLMSQSLPLRREQHNVPFFQLRTARSTEPNISLGKTIIPAV